MDPPTRVAPVRLLVLGDGGVGKTSLVRLLTSGPAAPDPGVADLDDEEHPEVRVYVGDALLRGMAVPLEFLEPTDESFEGVAELHSQVDGEPRVIGMRERVGAALLTGAYSARSHRSASTSLWRPQACCWCMTQPGSKRSVRSVATGQGV